MSEVLDNIVNCEISIESPMEDAASFGTIMLIGDRPLSAGKDLRVVDKYVSLAEVVDAGWKEDEAVYRAARLVFLQEHKPECIGRMLLPVRMGKKIPPLRKSFPRLSSVSSVCPAGMAWHWREPRIQISMKWLS